MQPASAAHTINRLRLVPDQPVEGCELSPEVFFMGGTRAETVEWRWYRSTERMACSWCGKTPVTMQRLTDNSYYCSVNCFCSAWRGHAAQHRTGLSTKVKGGDGEGWNNPDAEGEGKSTEQKWIEVADTQCYTPSVDDVGHMLKLVRARTPPLQSPSGPLAPLRCASAAPTPPRPRPHARAHARPAPVCRRASRSRRASAGSPRRSRRATSSRRRRRPPRCAAHHPARLFNHRVSLRRRLEHRASL